MTKKITREEICAKVKREYTEGKTHKESLDIYENVKLCERFYNGDQWHGLKVVETKPLTMNFLRRVVAYFNSMIVADNVSFELRPFLDDDESVNLADILTNSVKRVIEREKMISINRESLRDAAVDGDSCIYFWFDPDERTGAGGVQGEIKAELIMNTNIIFGNPYSSDVQKQPYLLIVRRRPAKEVRREAKEANAENWESIRSDSAGEYQGDDADTSNDLTTEIIRLWKRTAEGNDVKTVHFTRICGDCVLQEATDTGMTRYPVAYWSWMPKKNSCHGVQIMKEVIPTQIAVNQMWTAVKLHTQNIGFPKIIYDTTKFQRGWDSTPGKAIGIPGGAGAIKDAISEVNGVPLSAAVTNAIDMMISSARDFMGASDAALGNIKPDNTSAIIAVQKASSAPLELQKQAFYQCVEDYLRVIVDMMHAYYGLRQVKRTGKSVNPMTGVEEETQDIIWMDFSQIDEKALDLNVDVGAGSYWSELTQLSTMDALLTNGIITSKLSYLESLPDGLIKNKSDLIKNAKEEMQMQQAAQMQEEQTEAPLQAVTA